MLTSWIILVVGILLIRLLIHLYKTQLKRKCTGSEENPIKVSVKDSVMAFISLIALNIGQFFWSEFYFSIQENRAMNLLHSDFLTPFFIVITLTILLFFEFIIGNYPFEK